MAIMRRKLLRGGVGLLAVTLAGVAFVAVRLRDGTVKRQVTAELSRELKADVTVDSLSVRLFPSIQVVGEGVTIQRWADAQGHPPIIVARRFTVEPGLWHALRGRARHVEVEGLRVTIPRSSTSPAESALRTPHSALRTPPPALRTPHPALRTQGRVLVERLTARDVELVYVSRRPGGGLRVFQVHRLELGSLGFDRPMEFDTTMTNPLPRGLVTSRGLVGPFDVDEPGRTAVEGSFDLTEASFATMPGLRGGITSRGLFAGQLDEVEVNGTTTSGDFQLDAGGHPMPLTTEFRAVVDATTGDLQIIHLDGLLGASAMTASGSITRIAGTPGHQIALDVEFPAGRVEDLLKIAVAAPPMMVGDVTLKARLLLPSGTGRAIDRMDLDGTIGVHDAQFSNRALQARLRDASRRAQGRTADDPPDRAVAGMTGAFRLRRGVVRFSALRFATAGARISVTGTYGLAGGELNFRGTARLDASVSRTVGGVKGFFLKAIDPIFRKDGAGAVLPIRIRGTFDQPNVGLEFGRILKR